MSRPKDRPPARLWSAVVAAMLALAAAAAAAAETGAAQVAALAAADRVDEAVTLADRLLAADPGDADTLALRAELLRRSDRLEAARADYLALAERVAQSAESWFWVGTIDRWRGRHEAALEAYARTLTLDLDHLGALTGRARVYLDLEQPAAAETELRRALAAHPGEPEAGRLLALSLVQQGRLKEARRQLRAGLAGAELWHQEGELELAAGHPARAGRKFRRALVLDPASTASLRGLGEAERRRGDDLAALAAFRDAARLSPEDLGSRYWVGVLATRTGRRAEALAAWEEILASEPDNTAALVGKARVLFYGGRRDAALALVDSALALAPANTEARTLRAAILAASGRLRDAGSDYRAVLAAEPGNGDARIGFERVAEHSSWEVLGESDAARVVEGLDDAGLEVGGVTIRPTRIEYLNEGLTARLRRRIGNGSGFSATVSQRREAVSQLDSGSFIYDLDVSEASAGLDHRLADGLRLSWRVAGTRYEPSSAGAIAEDSRAHGSLALAWNRGRLDGRLSVERRPFIYRSFASDTQFRIFDHDRVALRLAAALGGSARLEAALGTSRFSGEAESDSPASASLAVRWQRGRQSGAVVLLHTPFPERFLSAGGALRFVDYDALRLEARSRLAAGWRVELDAEAGRYGATARTVEQGGRKLAGPPEENARLTGRLAVAWSPPRWQLLSLGVEGFADQFDFDTGPYNTVDAVAATAFMELAGDGTRGSWHLRLESSRIDDDRDSDYDRHAARLGVEARLGRAAGAAARLGLEGRWASATLAGAAGRFDEEQPGLRLYLRVPL